MALRNWPERWGPACSRMASNSAPRRRRSLTLSGRHKATIRSPTTVTIVAGSPSSRAISNASSLAVSAANGSSSKVSSELRTARRRARWAVRPGPTRSSVRRRAATRSVSIAPARLNMPPRPAPRAARAALSPSDSSSAQSTASSIVLRAACWPDRRSALPRSMRSEQRRCGSGSAAAAARSSARR